MVRLLPDPWVCQTTPMRWSPGSPPGFRPDSYRPPSSASCVSCTLQLCCPQCLVHGDLDGVELVVARHLLDQGTAAVVLEDDEVA